MASLLDPLPDDARSFLRVAGDGFVAAGGCWQWVRQQLWTRHGLDAEQILGGLPTWEYDYRPVRLGYRGQPVPKIADEVPLSIHGMAYVYPAVPAVRQLVDAFLTALKTAAVMQRNIGPEPTRPAELKVPGDDFTRTVNMAAGTERRPVVRRPRRGTGDVARNKSAQRQLDLGPHKRPARSVCGGTDSR
jgi:hypothetical protein